MTVHRSLDAAQPLTVQAAAMEETEASGRLACGICSTCGQKWTDQEKQAAPEQESFKVKWHKFHKGTGGEQKPSASECYRCFDVRRGDFGFIGQADLDKALAQSEALQELHSRLRQDRVRGVKRKRENIDAKQYVTTETASFQEEFEEGEFSSCGNSADVPLVAPHRTFRARCTARFLKRTFPPETCSSPFAIQRPT